MKSLFRLTVWNAVFSVHNKGRGAGCGLMVLLWAAGCKSLFVMKVLEKMPSFPYM
jgi:hypothetical protein